MKLRRLALVIIGGSLFAAGCDNVQNSPKMIDADGTRYLACNGLIW